MARQAFTRAPVPSHVLLDTKLDALTLVRRGKVRDVYAIDADRLLLVVDRAIEADRLRRENATLRRRAGGEVAFVGASVAVREGRVPTFSARVVDVPVAPQPRAVAIEPGTGSGQWKLTGAPLLSS